MHSFNTILECFGHKLSEKNHNFFKSIYFKSDHNEVSWTMLLQVAIFLKQT